MSVPRIRCHRCEKPVEAQEYEADTAMRKIIVTVWCHGETERMELEFTHTNLALMQDPNTTAVAFRPKLPA